MKPIKIETIEGKTVITTEEPIGMLWWKGVKQRRFMAVSQTTKSFAEWLELPDMTLVPDSLSFQLDAWKNHGIG